MRLCDQVKREQELNEKLTKRLAEDGNGSIVSQVPLVGYGGRGGGGGISGDLELDSTGSTAPPVL